MPHVFEKFRKVILAARLLGAFGRVERQGEVIHVKVDRLVDHTGMLALLTQDTVEAARVSQATARADEVHRPTPEDRPAQTAAWP